MATRNVILNDPLSRFSLLESNGRLICVNWGASPAFAINFLEGTINAYRALVHQVLKRRLKVVCTPGVLWAIISPPCKCIIALTIARPTPAEEPLVRAESAR